MFDLPAVVFSTTARTGMGQWIGEVVAVFGLLGVIFGTARANAKAIPAAVGCYVAGAIWFTSSTCFANPAVTIARVFTDTITGIRAVDVVPFMAAQLVGMAIAMAFFGWLYKETDDEKLARELREAAERAATAQAPALQLQQRQTAD
jgi:glycerol uptake facilitator-like aquaporin